MVFVVLGFTFVRFLFQRGVRHGFGSERRHQEAESAVPERDARETCLPRIRADEARQPQKRKSRKDMFALQPDSASSESNPAVI